MSDQVNLGESFKEATEDELRRLLLILDLLPDYMIADMQRWVDGSKFFYGNAAAVEVMERHAWDSMER